MKKIVLILSLVFALTALTACGNKNEVTDVPTENSNNQQDTETLVPDVPNIDENTPISSNEQVYLPIETEDEDIEVEEKDDEPQESTYKEADQTSDVKTSVKEKEVTVDTNQITIVYNNTSETEYTYGKRPLLEKKVDGKWYLVPMLDVMWDAMAYIMPSNEITEEVFDIDFNYGKLEVGEYRYIKHLYSSNDPTFTIVEFEIKQFSK